MIPAILALPLVQGVVGGVVNGVMNTFAPAEPSAPPTSGPTGSAAFNPYLAQASKAATAGQSSPVASLNGSMRADEWGQMGFSDLKSWMSSLSGKHVNATDESGRTISGVVSGIQQSGNNLALNIGGHLVSISQLKQVSWSPSIA